MNAKTLYLTALSITLILALSACTAGSDAPQTSSPPDTSGSAPAGTPPETSPAGQPEQTEASAYDPSAWLGQEILLNGVGISFPCDRVEFQEKTGFSGGGVYTAEDGGKYRTTRAAGSEILRGVEVSAAKYNDFVADAERLRTEICYDVVFPCNIVLGESTLDDAIAAYGETRVKYNQAGLRDVTVHEATWEEGSGITDSSKAWLYMEFEADTGLLIGAAYESGLK